jgi:hypothetical protein
MLSPDSDPDRQAPHEHTRGMGTATFRYCERVLVTVGCAAHLGWRGAIRSRRKHRGQLKAGPHEGPPRVSQIAKSRHVAGPSQDACLDELKSSRRPFGRHSLAHA